MTEPCLHEDFRAHVKVGRITQEDDGPVVYYSAELRVQCTQCDVELEFVGVPVGTSAYYPMMTVDQKELRAPMVEPGKSVPDGLAGYEMRIADALLRRPGPDLN